MKHLTVFHCDAILALHEPLLRIQDTSLVLLDTLDFNDSDDLVFPTVFVFDHLNHVHIAVHSFPVEVAQQEPR